ncbi:MAG: hypothetical protein QMD09_04380 [Desulfatibacillaceae bacterium]|nr:hypothetical protein [Desulfatibacillaceae bacterium]
MFKPAVLVLFCLLFLALQAGPGLCSSGQIGSGLFAFTALVDGNWELFFAQAQGGTATRLTHTLFDERDPCLSPDRKKIAYSTSDGALHIMDISSRQAYTLEFEEKDLWRSQPVFSPDAKKILFVETVSRTQDYTRIRLFDLESGQERPSVSQRMSQFWPSFAPDGRRFVYAAVHCAVDCGKILQELWLGGVSGGFARQLVLTHALNQQPVFSPDGTKIAFCADISGNYDIWILTLADLSLKNLTQRAGLDMGPTWSPDGRQIAFVSNRGGRLGVWIQGLEEGSQAEEKSFFADKTVPVKDVDWK